MDQWWLQWMGSCQRSKYVKKKNLNGYYTGCMAWDLSTKQIWKKNKIWMGAIFGAVHGILSKKQIWKKICVERWVRWMEEFSVWRKTAQHEKLILTFVFVLIFSDFHSLTLAYFVPWMHFSSGKRYISLSFIYFPPKNNIHIFCATDAF